MRRPALSPLTTPVPVEVADRLGETLIAVVDRSGSMLGGPMHRRLSFVPHRDAAPAALDGLPR